MKDIVIIPNIKKDIGLNVTKKLVNFLHSKANIYMDEFFTDSGFDANFVSHKILFDKADCVIVLGGDGTILNAAVHCGKRHIPIMGINLGKVGFMTEVNTSEIENACEKLLNDKYIVEKRMMMKITVKKSGKYLVEYHALNDVVVSKSYSPMIAVKIYSGNDKINEYAADGIIVATPTGSTGYSLSAGGPVADPTMELFIASPVCAHMLHARPALMPADKKISLSITSELGKEAFVTVDGKIKEKIVVGDEVIIEKSEYYVDIIKLGDQSFYDILIEKLK